MLIHSTLGYTEARDKAVEQERAHAPEKRGSCVVGGSTESSPHLVDYVDI